MTAQETGVAEQVTIAMDIDDVVGYIGVESRQQGGSAVDMLTLFVQLVCESRRAGEEIGQRIGIARRKICSEATHYRILGVESYVIKSRTCCSLGQVKRLITGARSHNSIIQSQAACAEANHSRCRIGIEERVVEQAPTYICHGGIRHVHIGKEAVAHRRMDVIKHHGRGCPLCTVTVKDESVQKEAGRIIRIACHRERMESRRSGSR